MKKKFFFLVAFVLIILFSLGGCNSYVSSQSLQLDWLVFLLSLTTTIIFIAFYFWIKRSSVKYKELKPEYKGESETTFLFIVCGVFFLRLLFAVLIKGFRDDIADLSTWALYLADNGPFAFYKAYPSADILPAYVYILSVLGSIARLFNFSDANNTMALLLKIPNIICDMISMYLIFKITKKYSNDTFALILSLLFGLNFANLFLSAVWGTYDSIVIMLILFAVYYMIEKKICKMIAAFFIAMLFKPYTMIFLPLFVVYIAGVFIKNKKTDYSFLRKDIIITSVLCAALSIILYFSLSFNELYNANIFKLLYDKLIYSGYKNYSYDAFNLFTLIGLNDIKMNLFGLIINYVILLLIIVGSIILFVKKKDRNAFPLICALTLAAFSTLATQISPPLTGLCIMLLFASFAIYRDLRLYIISAVMSFLSFFNMAVVLNALKQLNAYILNNTYEGISPDGFWMILGSVLQLLSFIYLCYLTYDLTIRNNKRIITNEDLSV